MLLMTSHHQRYVNEPNGDAAPNAMFGRGVRLNGEGYMGLFSTRSIAVGEEVTVDYGPHYARSSYEGLGTGDGGATPTTSKCQSNPAITPPAVTATAAATHTPVPTNAAPNTATHTEHVHVSTFSPKAAPARIRTHVSLITSVPLPPVLVPAPATAHAPAIAASFVSTLLSPAVLAVSFLSLAADAVFSAKRRSEWMPQGKPAASKKRKHWASRPRAAAVDWDNMDGTVFKCEGCDKLYWNKQSCVAHINAKECRLPWFPAGQCLQNKK